MPERAKIIIASISIVTLFGLVGIQACSKINDRFGLADDHPIEEFLEEQIQNKTGFDFDLSPGTPENDM